jgi:hypothetical protein
LNWNDRGLAVVELATGGKRWTLDGRFVTATLSANGRFVAAADLDDTIHIHDLATRERVLELKAHRHRITALAFAPNGKSLASASDATVLLWDLASLANTPTREVGEAKLKACWADLAEQDSARAYRGMADFCRTAGASVAFLTIRLQEIGGVDGPGPDFLLVEPAHLPNLRIVRAVEVLECLGTPEARKALEELADVKSVRWAARTALQRLAARSDQP